LRTANNGGAARGQGGPGGAAYEGAGPGGAEPSGEQCRPPDSAKETNGVAVLVAVGRAGHSGHAVAGQAGESGQGLRRL
jgi:hypothetical protein